MIFWSVKTKHNKNPSSKVLEMKSITALEFHLVHAGARYHICYPHCWLIHDHYIETGSKCIAFNPFSKLAGDELEVVWSVLGKGTIICTEQFTFNLLSYFW